MSKKSFPETVAIGKAGLLATVTCGGGAVMILELLGTRIIAPYYGVSLHVWSSLIAVTMIALATGYYLGGFLADRYPRIRLAHIFALASLTTVVIPFVSAPVMQLTNLMGIRAGAFASALLLFSAPLTALAMVGPFAIKLATRDLRGVGRAVGSVYAVSTLGSVVATLVLGFYLLPLFGTRAIIFSLSLLLFAWALPLMWRDRAGFNKASAALPLWLIGIAVGLLSANGYATPHAAGKGFKVVHAEESVYGWVRVVDDLHHGYRLLLSDSSVLSAVELEHGRSLLSYQAVLSGLPLFRPQATDALLIGLGGGHVARDLKSRGLTTDTMEIDPAVASAALDYFHFKPTGDFIVGDARYEVTKLKKQYDFVIHDCFTGGSEPTHLLTVEMLRELKGLLKNQGVLALNYVGYTHGEGAEAVASVYKTLKSVLPEVSVYITEKAEFTDFIFLASNGPIVLDSGNPDKYAQWLLDHAHVMDDSAGILITDDYNPLESMQVRKAEEYRKVFMQRIAPELLFL
ncbi:fused MFS/spermidine synthase [Methylomonas sp. SURF-2]|uniref:Fused MFS/spermidine synthase n=1 Tax=Methylomonas subterranea TaxID=2952225 RepID=A0ABT1THC1_9GAMM|nr:fused MFS/spermidine synthase [Methylomonas sp. SURF-2]MCQ8104864.1 fused MFS/spermidine synthase [Methylomonas sp. SURF-2]